VDFPTPFVPSSTSVEATLHPESGGGTLFQSLSFTPTPSHLASRGALALSQAYTSRQRRPHQDARLRSDHPRASHRATGRARAEQNALEKRETVVLAAFVLVF